jgi:thiamine-monophosphate kinase
MMSKMSEFDYISWLRRQSLPNPRVLVGPGDDAAVLDWSNAHPCLVTTDMLMDGIDFHLSEAGPFRVGRKAMAANLSDIAAMAGRPVAAVAAVALPRTGDSKLAEELYRGLRDVADAFDTPIVGGDTNSWQGPLVISVTVLGEAVGRRPVLRNGAKPGDCLMVTGPLGGSLSGKHLDFTPRVREALQLAEAVRLHAMIDISDGLAADVGHICEESNCGALLDAESIPVSGHAESLEQALFDGEDFELAFAIEQSHAHWLIQNQPIAGIRLSAIGEFVEEKGLWLEQGPLRKPLQPKGWVHEL